MRTDELPLFLKVPQVQDLTGLGRSVIYDQMRLYRETAGREGIPNVPFGRTLRIPTAGLLRLALVDVDAPKEGLDDS